MAIKKSDLYSSLWASYEALLGDMDPNQNKDYVQVLLFIKYVSDKYSDVANSLFEFLIGSSFKEIAAAKG